uniref:Oxidoreductase n=1 Tax=Chromera velia CCMP2878 TaxID=1169474 RepID=A0A0K6S6R6_9ALVE|eukprot:Cvel_17101.t2-p1 / transcript=Cvel_17101.t2 / gene=Cvel_17101 / organism=Chromera_velia_CCMP2878 / gene_product=Levodione reductase, putative / transcript_product=Levodione reductase, putative / location=Cvel_scaffold1348:31298-35746(-) / protein_length=268 / sequence_SO=supercontig / SO=protein_coding / is_pseudo=false
MSATYEMKGTGFCPRKEETVATDRFKGKVILVTGAAVALMDVRPPEATASRLREDTPSVEVLEVTCDITDSEQVEQAVSSVVSKFGRIDLLFNNAGYQGEFKNAVEYDPADFQKVQDINVCGTFNVLRAVSRAMKEQKPRGGAIVQTASMAAHSGPANMIAYASSKAAVFHMTRTAAKDLACFDIRVNSVSPAFIGPGFMWTRQVELQAQAGSVHYDKDPNVVAEQMINSTFMRRYGSISEVIGVVAFLLSDDASYLTGQDIQITGGM